jgi:signal transduction histidine kinase/ligand-binding sensor domain-containing protein
MSGQSFIIVLIALLTPALARALDPSVKISQYGHHAWLSQDGYFSGTPRAIAQTQDGYIWIGTGAGILRFNSIQFSPEIIPGDRLPSQEIISLLAAKDGSLWIGTRRGLARYKDRAVFVFPDFHDFVSSILEDSTGDIWISREGFGASSYGPICKISGSTLHCLSTPEGLEPRVCCARPLAQDRTGKIWIGTDRSLISWQAGISRTYPITATASGEGLDGVNDLLVARDGTLWVGLGWPGKGGGLQRFKPDQGFSPITSPGFDSSTLNVICLLIDRNGALWVGTGDQGIYRVNGDRVEHFGANEGLSGDLVTGIFEDREGDVWTTTSRGIDCFHQLPVISFSKREGLSGENVVSVISSGDNSVWLANGNSLEAISRGHVFDVQSGHGLPGHEVTSLFEDHAGRLFVGVDNNLFRYEHGLFLKVTRRDGSGTRFVVGMTEDTQHDIWAEISGTKRELIRIRNLKVIDEFLETNIPSARSLAADPRGGIWLGLRDGNLAHFQTGSLKMYPSPNNSNSEVRQVLANSEGSVFATTSFGLVVWKDGKSRTLTTHNGLPCNGVIGVAWDNKANVWLYTECGLVRIPGAEFKRWEVDQNTVVTPKVLSPFDGVQPGVPDYNPMATTRDGKLWFANQFILQSVDPAYLVRNLLPPPVHIEKVVANRKPLAPRSKLQLPPLMQDLEIDYAALSFVNPRAVRFRYRLEGHDSNWVDAETRRQAFYTDLDPGDYRFQVIACNNDGIWNQSGAVLYFSVAPAWYQTLWFKLSVGISIVSTAVVLFFLDRRRYTAILRIRYNERLEERTRVARDLHDTLIQTIQGTKMVVDEAAESPANGQEARQTFDLLSAWLERALIEGRVALASLRVAIVEDNDLTAALRRAADECKTGSSITVSMTVTGRHRELHPIVRDEIYLIGYEALRNACIHSHCAAIDIELSYGRDFRLTVRDDGCGISEQIQGSGKPGHFGLASMRERALRIGGKLTVTSSSGTGTEVSLVVPGKSSLWWRL